MQNNIEYYAMQCNAIQIIMKNYAWEIIGNYVSMQYCSYVYPVNMYYNGNYVSSF
jgi:hypothetical protein